LSSCAFLSPKFKHPGGPNLEPEAASINTFTKNQDTYLNAFARTAGLCQNLTQEELAKCSNPDNKKSLLNVPDCQRILITTGAVLSNGDELY
jgi:hypothetical protein